jgi:hypothetical protein
VLLSRLKRKPIKSSKWHKHNKRLIRSSIQVRPRDSRLPRLQILVSSDHVVRTRM